MNDQEAILHAEALRREACNVLKYVRKKKWKPYGDNWIRYYSTIDEEFFHPEIVTTAQLYEKFKEETK